MNENEKLQLKIGGMHCSLCTNSIHRALERMDGVQAVQVSLAHEEALVHYDPKRVKALDIQETLEDLGYTVHPPDQAEIFEAEEQELNQARRKAFIAGVLLAAASMIMLVRQFAGPHIYLTLSIGGLAFVTTLGPARFIIVRNGWQSLRRGILNQDVLVSASALGGLVGGLASLVAPAIPGGGFFGATVFVLGFHLIGGYASVFVHVRASQSVRRLLAMEPPTARRIGADGNETVVSVEELLIDDWVQVRPGERIPVDGVVVEGASTADESLVTGEPIPHDKLSGDAVIGGSLNQAGSLVIRVTRVGKDTFLRTVARYVAEARAMKPGILRLVDRVLLIYVPVVFTACVVALMLWSIGPWIWAGNPDLLRAGFAALSVLIMGYPCALGMATPLAILRASGDAAAQGILMRSGEAFQIFRNVKVIVFDKTGTLTEGKPELMGCFVPEGDSTEILRLAASAETLSEHPLARAIVQAAQTHAKAVNAIRAKPLPLSKPAQFTAHPGRGVRAVVEEQAILVGTERFLNEEGIDTASLRPLVEKIQTKGQTAVFVALNGKAVGLLALADQPKPDAKETIKELRRLGLQPVLITGDNKRTAQAVAEELGIPSVMADVLPGQKADEVRRLQGQGVRVAMVGDGMNDAPALMQADVGIAVGAGTDIAIESADVVLIGERLWTLAEARDLAQRSYQLTLTNVILALTFNSIGVLAALTGLVQPVWAMVAMAVSVSIVLLNSFVGRLQSRKPIVRQSG
jgi:heavy metal translocating P-type ATPase